MATQSNRLLADYFNLAEASYADFSKARDGLVYDDKRAKNAMSKKKEDGGIEKPKSLAELVFENYEIAAHWKDRKDESGFSGTLFKGKNGGNNPGKYVLALKGTAGLQDLLTDGGDVGADGLAHHQIVDLYNFWQQITHTGRIPGSKNCNRFQHLAYTSHHRRVGRIIPAPAKNHTASFYNPLNKAIYSRLSV